MKLIIFWVAILLYSVTMHSAEHNSDANLEITVQDLEKYISAFLNGMHVGQYINGTADCKENIDYVLDYSLQAYAEFKKKKYYDGALSTADALGKTSPLARNCSTSTDQIIAAVHTYMGLFDSFSEWINMTQANVKSNLFKITLDSNFIVLELQKTNPNYTYVSQLTGEIVYLSCKPNTTMHILEYTWTDPLAPSPLNENLWVFFESIYEFLISSKLVTEVPLSNCEANLISMLLYQFDSYANIKAKNTQEGVFLALDSFIFLHDIVEQCTIVGTEAYVNGTVVFERVKENPDTILANFKDNLFQVLSGSAATYAQIYYKDIINLSKAVGDIVFRTLVSHKD